MPDIGVPLYTQPAYTPPVSTSIQDVDLPTIINKSPTPTIQQKPVDPGNNTAIPFNFDANQYGKPLRVFDEKSLNSVAGYNSFKTDPTYNPEFNDIQNIRDYAAKQGSAEWLANSFAKLASVAKDSFWSTFEQNGRNFQALTSLDASKLFNTQDTTSEQERMRNKYPTYGTGELDNSMSRFLPWNFGKSDFGGEMLPQLGFTIGTMGETLLENWLIGMTTGGIGNALEGAKTASSIGKVGKGLIDLFETGSGITNFRKGLAVLNTIKNESSLGANIGQGVIKGAKLLANAYAMFNTAGGEAAFEANQAYNDQIKSLTDEYKQKNGYAPFGDDLKKIQETSSKTATSVFGWNIPILLGSDLFQFGNILKPFKGVLAEGTENVAMKLAGKGLSKSIESVAEKEVTSLLGKAFKFTKHALAEPIMEGVEEISQSAGQNLFGQYYKDLYNGLSTDTSLHNSLNAMFQYGGSKAFQDDFFGGFLGGAVFKGVGAASSKLGIQERMGFDTDKAKADRQKSITNSALDILNSTSNEDLINYLFDPQVQNFISQGANKQALVLAAESNDRLKFNDIKSKAVRELIYSGLQTGKLDLALSKLDIFKELDNDELAQTFNIQDKSDIDKAKTTASELVDNIKQRAYDLQSDWNSLNQKYKNPYPPKIDAYNMYEAAKRDRLFSKDIVKDEQKRAQGLRSDIVMSSDVTDAIMDQAVDQDVLNKSIDDLNVFVKDAPDKDNVNYRRKQTQLALLKEIQHEKEKKAPDNTKIAKLAFALGNVNKSTLDIGQDEEFNTQRIEDVLKLEARNKKNVAEYMLLNQMPIEESVQQHLVAAHGVLNKVKEQASKKTQQTETTIDAEPVTTDNKDIVDLVNTEDNYNTWNGGNVDSSTRDKFIDAINFGLSQFDKATPAQLATLSKQDINDALLNQKAFANAEVRAKVVDALFNRFNPKPVETVTSDKPTPIQTDDQKEAEENKNQGPTKLAKYKFATDKTPPSEQLSTSNPSDNQFHRRKDQFLENLHLQTLPKEGQKGKFWKKEDIKVLVVTPNNAGKYGKNISTVLKNSFSTTKPIDKLTPEEYKALDEASVMFLFVVQDGKELKPITKDGKLLPALNGASDYNIPDLVYTFNESSFPDNYKDARFNQGDDLNKLVQLHRNQRYKWLNSKDDITPPFEISHGIPNMQKKDKQVIRILNTVQDTKLLPSNHVYNPDDIYIPTSKEEFEKTSTNLVTARYLRSGMPYLRIKDKDGNTVDYQRLENGKLTPNQKGSILYAFKSLIEDYFANDQLVALTESNDNYNFIENLLFLQEGNPYKDAASIKVLQDTKAGTITVQYDFSSGQPKFFTFRKESDTSTLLDNTQFKTWLDNRYTNIRKPSNRKFTEVYVDNKTPRTREWDNYTQYLLDTKTPSGATRDINEIPLKVELYTPQQQEAYYEGGNAYPTKRKQYYIKLGDKIVDDKANEVKANQKPAKQTKTTASSSTGNDLADLAAIIAKNKADLETSKNPTPTQTPNTTPNPTKQAPKHGAVATLDLATLLTTSPLASPATQVAEIVAKPEPQPTAEDNDLAKIASIMAANKAALEAQKSGTTSSPKVATTELVDESPFDADEIAPDNAPEPEPSEVISLRGKKKSGKIYPRGFTRISNYSKENTQGIKDYFKRNLPQVYVETVDQLIKLADGKLAWGTFSDSVVKLYEEAEAGTGYHEAFEVVFNAILIPREQANLIREFKNRKGTFSNFATDGNVSYKNATTEQAKEEIAEEFLRYKLTGEVKEDTRNIFQKILDFILNFLRNLSSIEDVFSKLDKGFYANKELTNTGQVYNRLAGVGAIEEGQYLKGITYEMVSKLFQDTKSFTQFDETFDEKRLYNDLYNQLNDFYNSDDEDNPNTYRNVVADLYLDRIDFIENSKFAEDHKAALIKSVEVEFTKKLNTQRERFNTVISFQWKQLVADHKTYLKQLGVINFVEVEQDEDGDQDNKNSNEYTKNEFKIDTKNTAPASIKLLFNTIAESTFNFEETQEISNGLSIPLIQPKISNATGLVNLYDNGGQLFNIVLSQVSEINTLDGIKAKLESMLGIDRVEELQGNPEELNKYIQSRIEEEQYKNNSVYTHLFKIYTRIFATPENLLTEAEWKQRLKFLSTFSRQKPEFWQLVSGEDDTFLMDELRDTGRKQIVSKWFFKFGSNVFDKKKVSLINRQNKKSPFVLNTQLLTNLLGLTDIPTFIAKSAEALGMEEINANFIDNLTGNERTIVNKKLRSILNFGFSNIFNGKTGNKVFGKLNSNVLGVNSPYNDIAEIVLAKKGDEIHSVHSNIEGEQQQNIILNNEVSNRLASFNRHPTLESYKLENPEFNDTFVQSSILLGKIYDRNGERTAFNPKIAVISGTRESSRDNGKKSSNQNLTERLYQEFNVNLDGKFYILLPADAETEWGINVGKETYLEYKDNVINNTATFVNYLKSEIEVAQQFVNPEHEFYANRNADEYLSQTRPLRDGSERKVGASLQVFKDILSDELVAAIHNNIDSLSPIEDIVNQYEFEINRDIKIWINKRVEETFLNLNKAEIVERKGRQQGEFENSIQPNSQYIFYGLNSSFNRLDSGTRFPLNEGEVKRGQNTSIEQLPNQYVLTSSQLRNLIAFREMSYAINNIEMTKLFVGNPYFYKDIQKRVKSFLSTTENTYVQNVGDIHKADDWFNSHLNSVRYADKNKKTVESRLPSSHIHNHEFSSSIKTWVFRDHQTLNKELAAFNEKYTANNATDAQSFMTPNAYREFYWKSGAKFRDAQEKQFQLEQAFERFLMDEDGVYPYTDSELKALDQKLLEGNIKETKNGYELTAKFDVFEVFKPKGSGTLGGVNTFDPYIWKTSVGMLNYRMVRNTPMETAYLKMLNERVHMLTFESAIKVGLKRDASTGKVNNLIDTNSFSSLGKISSGLSSYTHQLPFKSLGVQVETSTQKNKGTIGTQTTKLILTDLFEYGIPTDFLAGQPFGDRMSAWYGLGEKDRLEVSKHYSLEKEHQKAIENLENIGYYALLDRLGIKEITKNGRTDYEYEDLSKVYELLKDEMVKRGLSPNLYEMFDDMTLKVKPIEALSNYAQASFIIMSIVRKSIIKPKLNGGQKIQASSALLNDLTDEKLVASYYNKSTKKWEDITTQEQFDEIKKNGDKIMYNSSQLGFYSKNEDGTLNVMEVMLPNVFREKLAKYRKAKGLEQLSDDELLTWIAKNQPKLLEGIGFRIPTQALSSIDTFKIKKFLPSYFGDTVIVPSELTTKVGSDFDVDKLNTYLNNYSINRKGYPEYLQADLEDTPQAANRRWKKYSYGKKLLETIENSIKELTQRGILQDRNAEAFMATIADDVDSDERIEDILQQLDEEGNPDIIKRIVEANDMTLQDLNSLRNKVDNMKSEEEFKALPLVLQNKKGALENHYFSTINKILHLPQNFDKMLSPNNSDEFDQAGALRDKVVNSLGGEKDNLEKIAPAKRGKYINYSNILDSNKMRYSRWAFVIGKKGVGIAALSATNHVNSQKIGFQLNPSIKSKSSWWSNKVFGKQVEPTLIKFKHNQLIINDRTISVLSGITKAKGENIAEFVSKYVNGYVDVAKDAWILDIGAQMEVAGIYLFMERLGINSEEIIYFLNQPIIKYYLNVTALRNSPIKNINPKVKAQVELSNNDDKLHDFIKNTLVGSQDIKPISTFELSNLKNTIEKFSSIPIANWKTNSTIPVREKELQFLVFRHFMQLKDYSNYIRASQQASNHDTANLNSLHILDDKDQLLSTFLSPTADNLITSIETRGPMASALRTRTFVGNITERLNDLDGKFLSKDLFRIQSRAVRTMLRSIMMRVNPFLFNENDKREMMDKITKVTINALVLNSDFNNKGKLIDNLDTVMKADKLRDTIAKVQAILKNPDESYKQQLKDANVDLAHLISNRWINNIDVESINPDSDYGYIAIQGTKPSDNFEKQVWIEDFRKLQKVPFTRNLYKSILAAAMYQGGAEHNRVSLLDLIPWEEYTPIINNGLDNLSQLGQTNLMRTIAQLKSFDKSYFVPKDFISTGNVNGTKYYAKTISLLGKAKDDVSVSALKDLYSPSSPYAAWLPASEHVNPSGEKVTEISSVILVPFSPYQDKQEYFTLRQRSSNYTTEEVKAMLEAKNSDYKTTILLEKAPMIYDNGFQTYLVYRPINTKGGRYIQELAFNNEYSKIDTHDKINTHLTNDDALFKLLSGKFGAFIKKTDSFPEAVIPSVIEEDPTSQDSNTIDDIPFEEVPDENKELPQSQKLLEDSTDKEQAIPDIENTSANDKEIDLKKIEKDFENYNEHPDVDFYLKPNVGKITDETLTNLCDMTANVCITYLYSKGINVLQKAFHIYPTLKIANFNGNFANHKVAISYINEKMYIFDMPQNEYIVLNKDNKAEFTEFKPRFIEVTPENMKKYYGIDQESYNNTFFGTTSGRFLGSSQTQVLGKKENTYIKYEGNIYDYFKEGSPIYSEKDYVNKFINKKENINPTYLYKIFSPDDLPTIDPENAVEGTCE